MLLSSVDHLNLALKMVTLHSTKMTSGMLAGPVRQVKRTEEKKFSISRSINSSPLPLPTYPKKYLYFIPNYCQILPGS